MIVARDGKVFPCCSDWDRTYEIGDANTTDLKTIWKDDRMETLRDINREGRLDETDPCRFCFVLSSYEWRPMTEDEKAERDRIAEESEEKVGQVVRIDDQPVKTPEPKEDRKVQYVLGSNRSKSAANSDADERSTGTN